MALRPKDLSEFSFGYALTEALVTGTPQGVSAAPLFPTQVKEGQAGGGYDVQLDFHGSLLFLQFKLSDEMERRSAYETRHGVLEPHFFRMNLRSSAKSDQHKLLLDLENTGNEVYYAAPKFTSAVDLNDAYLNHQVVQRTAFITPGDIGPLPNHAQHWVSFRADAPVGFFFSKNPTKVSLLDGEALLKRLGSKELVRHVTEADFADLRDRMQDIVLAKARERRHLRRRARVEGAPGDVDEELRAQFGRLRGERIAHQAVGYLSRTFYGAEALYIRQP